MNSNIKFDVFICFKNTDKDGNDTEDFEISSSLYNSLVAKGIKTFFAPVSVDALGTTDYSEAIDYALDCVKVLVVVGTNVNYLNSKWVYKEWSGFSNDILSGRKDDGSILSYVKNMSVNDMPRTLRERTVRNINTTSIDDLIKCIEKLLENPDSVDSDLHSKNLNNQIENQFATNFHGALSKSVYTPDLLSELKRLEIQSQNSIEGDMKCLDIVFNNLNKEKPNSSFNVLDFGCAYGFVTNSRFGNNDSVERIIGIDSNQNAISKAIDIHGGSSKMLFYNLDGESEDFEEKFTTLLSELGIDGFDVIYSSLVLHHLKNPEKMLRILKKFLLPGGYVVLRGSDDGSKVCYPHEDLMNKIINMTYSVPGVSDRKNGRKLYSQVKNAYFKDIQTFSFSKDTSGFELEEREKLFEESFSYRINYFKKQLSDNPDSSICKRNYEEMRDMLEEFKNYFLDPGFWYCEYDYICIGKK